MKKIIGIIIAALVVGGMVLLLVGNRKKAQEQTSSVAAAGSTEVVTTYRVSRELCDRSFSSNGVAAANSELNFVSEVSGRVVAIYVDKGSRVAKGTPVLKIDSELLEADYKATLASYESLKKDEERFTRSYEAGGVTSQQLDNAVVKAPIAGTINNRLVEVGALIAPNVPLFEIVDGSRIKVICNVPESKVRLITNGQKVVATSGDAAGKVFTGTVKSIGVKTDRGLNYPVEVQLDRNPDLHVGMYLKVNFETTQEQTGILIPRKAVVGSVLAANVYVAKDGKAERREVTLGEMYGDKIEIVSGLEDGDEIILAGLMNISDGTSINVVKAE